MRKIFSAYLTKTQKFKNKQYKTVDNSYKLLYSVYVDKSYAFYFCKRQIAYKRGTQYEHYY